MNQQYLQGLHKHLGITHDYDTWVNTVKDNNVYLEKLYNSLNIDKPYNAWMTNVWGKPAQPDASQSVSGTSTVLPSATSTPTNADPNLNANTDPSVTQTETIAPTVTPTVAPPAAINYDIDEWWELDTSTKQS